MPRCVIETRKSILSGKRDLSRARGRPPGRDSGHLHEGGSEVWMSKTCPDHGTFDDIISIDADFSRRSSGATRGATSGPLGDELVHGHGTSIDPLRPRRGAHGGPHQPLQHDVQPLLHGREPGGIRPRAHLRGGPEDPRRLDLVQAPAADVVQFSGGEPTISPHFLEACAYAKKVGYILGPGGDQRDPLRPRAGVRVPGEGGGAATWSTSSSTGRQRGERAPPRRRTCSTSSSIAIDNLARGGDPTSLP